MTWAFEWKNSRGYRYMCLVQKRRTEKGPRNVRQIYVGTADSLFQKLQGPPATPLRSFPFGKTAALLHAVTETGLLEAFQRETPRGLFDGYAVENILFLQLAACVEKPLSREEMAPWISHSTLPLILPSVGHPSSRTLRRYLKRLYGVGEKEERGEGLLSRAVTHRIEGRVFETLLAKGIDPQWLLLVVEGFVARSQVEEDFKWLKDRTWCR